MPSTIPSTLPHMNVPWASRRTFTGSSHSAITISTPSEVSEEVPATFFIAVTSTISIDDRKVQLNNETVLYFELHDASNEWTSHMKRPDNLIKSLEQCCQVKVNPEPEMPCIWRTRCQRFMPFCTDQRTLVKQVKGSDTLQRTVCETIQLTRSRNAFTTSLGSGHYFSNEEKVVNPMDTYQKDTIGIP